MSSQTLEAKIESPKISEYFSIQDKENNGGDLDAEEQMKIQAKNILSEVYECSLKKIELQIEKSCN